MGDPHPGCLASLTTGSRSRYSMCLVPSSRSVNPVANKSGTLLESFKLRQLL